MDDYISDLCQFHEFILSCLHSIIYNIFSHPERTWHPGKSTGHKQAGEACYFGGIEGKQLLPMNGEKNTISWAHGKFKIVRHDRLAFLSRATPHSPCLEHKAPT